jgi:hypothetical protein
LFLFAETIELVIVISEMIDIGGFPLKRGLNLITWAVEYLKICHCFGERKKSIFARRINDLLSVS